MLLWKYEIYDSVTDKVLLEEGGFETEADAEWQARLEIKNRFFSDSYIRTLQEYAEDDTED